MSIETVNVPKLHCPYCHGNRLQVATSTQFSTFTNITSNRTTTAVLSENTRYWCCADCGNTFPFPQDVEQQAENCKGSARLYKVVAVILSIFAGLFLLLAALVAEIPPFSAFLTLIGLLGVGEALFCFSAVSKAEEKAQQLHAEYEDLLSKCME